ncbi:hypothetical protein OH456_00510 [Vibrio sp. La 4.2.2]|uniref:hypothetical protein n=1 Tax=Vibrio sp. La 4.2.2 TaxID=2998830 RepID=UPI0022CE2ADE|nr:hypothetical protein [Vibrio sp. La 4.2.2]MDA0106601.1 hypothetical protein [Vibrio sp. La 4.2.2]
MLKSTIVLCALFSSLTFASDLTIKSEGVTFKTYTDEDLANMPQTSIKTELPWLEGENHFTGVSLIELFSQANAQLPDMVTFVALNDYKVTISLKDIQAYNPIVANRKNGGKMSVRDKGPFWVIFPISQFPEINTTDYHAMMIWQLKEVSY